MDEYLPISPTMIPPSLDPIHALLMRKRNVHVTENLPVISHPTEDIRQLEEFCNQHGIIGFSCGKISPRIALQMLKSKMGVIDTENYNKSSTKKLLIG